MTELMTQFIQEFEERYKGGIPRWQAFKYIAEQLLALNLPLTIIETGTVRRPDSYKLDGASTLVWQWLAQRTLGFVASIDASALATSAARSLTTSEYVHVVCADSIVALSDPRGMLLGKHKVIESCNLLYLDSYDYSPPYALSKLHHAGELAAAWHKLPSGCLIAVDDCHNATTGKHVYVKLFMDEMGIKPLYESYITVWRKP